MSNIREDGGEDVVGDVRGRFDADDVGGEGGSLIEMDEKDKGEG